jgi:hypothetical protein
MIGGKMKSLKNLYIVLGAICLWLIIAMFIGCSNSGNNPLSGNFSLSVSHGSQMAKATANGLVITSAKIMVSNLRIKGTFIDTTNADNDSDVDEVILKQGPFVMNLGLTSDSNVVTINSVKAGTYYGAKFEIHKLNESETSPDNDFVDTLNNKTYSIVVMGSYNGLPFSFRSTMSAKQMIVFQQPINVTSTGFINVTLVVDPYSWFTVNGHVIDPTSAGSSSMINAQIRASFRQGFKDHDDGQWHEIGHWWGWLLGGD